MRETGPRDVRQSLWSGALWQSAKRGVPAGQYEAFAAQGNVQWLALSAKDDAVGGYILPEGFCRDLPRRSSLSGASTSSMRSGGTMRQI